MFRRDVRTASLAGLTREIKARREIVHEAIARQIEDDPSSDVENGASRIYRVFASFQSDFDTEEARFLGR